MKFFERFLLGGALMCYDKDNGDNGGAGDGGDGEGDNDGAGDDNGDNGDGGDGGDDSSGGDDNGEGDQGDKSKKTGSMLDELGEGEGTDFDFTTGEQPEGFPDDFWDAENNTVNPQALFNEVKKQEKIAKDLRAKMGKGEHKAPEKATDYKLELPEELAEIIPADDPLVAKAQERAHKIGMSQENFQEFVADMVTDMQAMAAENSDENSEANEAKRKEYVQEQIKAIGPNGAQVLRSVESWSKELLAEGTFSEADVETMKEEGLTSAKMVQMFNRLRSRMGGSDIPLDPVDDGLPPDSDIADMIDKAYESKDSSKIKKAEEMLDKRRAAGRPEKLQF